MSKHTPGPWVLRPSNAERWSCIVMPENNCRHPYDNVAYIQEMHEDKCTNKGAHMANARLIAAAPELLEALNQIIWKLERKEVTGSKFDGGVSCEFAKIDRNDAVIGMAREAIAKATREDHANA